jgi:hypothetical protein
MPVLQETLGIPPSPNIANNKVAYTTFGYGPSTDTSIVQSFNQQGLTCWFKDAPVVTASGHPIATRADGALWDAAAGNYVSIQNTSIGTVGSAKNGQ